MEALEQGDEMPVFEFIYKSKCLKMNLIMSNPRLSSIKSRMPQRTPPWQETKMKKIDEVTLIKNAIHRANEPRHFMRIKKSTKRVTASHKGMLLASSK